MAKHDLKALRTLLSRSQTFFQARRAGQRQSRNVATKQSPPSEENKDFVSIVDAPPRLVSVRQKHSRLGIAFLALIPVTAFALGTWQVQRLDWKTKLIAKFEDRLVRPPLPLPPRIDPDAIHEFDYRRVYATGKFRHDKEMLIGPRTQDGKDGYMVITPLEREGGSTVLVNRGWIARDKKYQQDRDPAALPQGEVTVSGLLREPWKKNMFTPNNDPENGKFYFPDVQEMAKIAGADPVWIEETMTPDLMVSWDREAKGIPIGRAPEVNLRNNHVQYIFTWYSLSAATALMMWMVLRKKPVDRSRRVRHVTNW
ncbi:Cytochrome oxidase assembly protein shy1 [Exophiala dermatitidis]